MVNKQIIKWNKIGTFSDIVTEKKVRTANFISVRVNAEDL
jgi:hypothetical protein